MKINSKCTKCLDKITALTNFTPSRFLRSQLVALFVTEVFSFISLSLRLFLVITEVKNDKILSPENTSPLCLL